MLKDLILRNRSYRRFDNNYQISIAHLNNLIDLARLSPSSRNQQALKFMLIDDRKNCELVFPTLAWAGYLQDWVGPEPEERPSAYIIIVGDELLGTNFDVDLGICSQSILLGAAELGLGGCMIASVNKKVLREKLLISSDHKILLVIALGKPVENVEIVPVIEGAIKYWRDENQTHYVPKRDLKDLLL